MGKRKHRNRGQRAEREAKRQARSERQLARVEAQAAVLRDRVHPEQAIRRFLTEQGVPLEDIVSLDAEGFVGAHKQVTGELVIPVTPPNENEDRDDSATPTHRP